jgi:preprotein translocase subunit SecB
MKPALIQLLDYFLTDLHVSANAKFNPKEKVPLRFEDFETGVEFAHAKDRKRQGKIILSLRYQPAAEANVPYRFAAEIVGELVVLDAATDELAERLFNTNGPSMLYGVLREIIRDATARGPYTGVILPSTSFYKPEPKKEVEAMKEPEPKPSEEQPKSAPTPTKPES